MESGIFLAKVYFKQINDKEKKNNENIKLIDENEDTIKVMNTIYEKQNYKSNPLEFQAGKFLDLNKSK